jgi:hypothetical protein
VLPVQRPVVGDAQELHHLVAQQRLGVDVHRSHEVNGVRRYDVTTGAQLLDKVQQILAMKRHQKVRMLSPQARCAVHDDMAPIGRWKTDVLAFRAPRWHADDAANAASLWEDRI